MFAQVMAKKAKLTIGHPEDNCDITAVINRKSADYIESLVREFQDAWLGVGAVGGWS